MAFGSGGKEEAPKGEAPKVELPGAVAGAVAGGAESVEGAEGSDTAVKEAAAGIAGRAANAVSLSAVAGALADASYEESRFGMGPVWIRVILAPDKARECGDVLHLRSEDGGYDRVKPISGFNESGKNTVDLLFEDAPTDKAFSLDVIDAGGVAHSMFSGIPYGDLRKSRNRD